MPRRTPPRNQGVGASDAWRNGHAATHSRGVEGMTDLILALAMAVVYLALCVAVACGILAVASLLEEDE